MKKLIFGLAALAALAVTARPAAAQYPAPAQGPVGQAGCQQCDPGSSGGYDPGHGYGFGLKGSLLGIFHNHHGGRNITTLPVAQGGQLAYPQNPFWRGPRDYFMWEPR